MLSGFVRSLVGPEEPESMAPEPVSMTSDVPIHSAQKPGNVNRATADETEILSRACVAPSGVGAVGETNATDAVADIKSAADEACVDKNMQSAEAEPTNSSPTGPIADAHVEPGSSLPRPSPSGLGRREDVLLILTLQAK